jgi:hypothetical protein
VEDGSSLCVLGPGGLHRLPGTGPASVLLGDVGNDEHVPSQYRQLISSLVYLQCGAEQDNPPHREDHEDRDKDSHGEGDEDYLHGWSSLSFLFLSCRFLRLCC